MGFLCILLFVLIFSAVEEQGVFVSLLVPSLSLNLLIIIPIK